MSFENEPQEEPEEQERVKLPLEEFQAAVDQHLEGTYMGYALLQMELKTDADGNITTNVIDNLKMALQTGDQMSQDETIKWKFRQMLDFLSKY